MSQVFLGYNGVYFADQVKKQEREELHRALLQKRARIDEEIRELERQDPTLKEIRRRIRNASQIRFIKASKCNRAPLVTRYFGAET